MPKPPITKPSNSPLAPLAVGLFIGAVTVGTIVLVWSHDREPHRYYAVSAPAKAALPTPPLAQSGFNMTTSPSVDPAVIRVASRFVCSCGTCGEERLEVCSCPTAHEERAFIQDQLRQGRSESEAAEALKAKYGGLKS